MDSSEIRKQIRALRIGDDTAIGDFTVVKYRRDSYMVKRTDGALFRYFELNPSREFIMAPIEEAVRVVHRQFVK